MKSEKFHPDGILNFSLLTFHFRRTFPFTLGKTTELFRDLTHLCVNN